MPTKTRRDRGAGKATEVNKPTGDSGDGPTKHDGRAHLTTDKRRTGERDFEERIWRRNV